VGANENGPELLEVAVLLVLHLGDTPAVLATLDSPAIRSGDVLLAANDGEGHGLDERACVLKTGVVVLLERRGVDLDVLGLDNGANPLLELCEVVRCEGVSLGDDGDQVDASTELLHDFNVQRLEAVTGGANEVQAGVHTEINLLGSARLLLLKHVALMLVVEELDDRLPRVAVVHVVAETRSVNDRKADLEELLLELGLGDLDLDGLVDLLCVTAAVVGVVLDGGGEKGVDEGGLAEARLASYHDSEGGTALRDNLVALVREVGNANWRHSFGHYV